MNKERFTEQPAILTEKDRIIIRAGNSEVILTAGCIDGSMINPLDKLFGRAPPGDVRDSA